MLQNKQEKALNHFKLARSMFRQEIIAFTHLEAKQTSLSALNELHFFVHNGNVNIPKTDEFGEDFYPYIGSSNLLRPTILFSIFLIILKS
jgi:hypothetical protein